MSTAHVPALVAILALLPTALCSVQQDRPTQTVETESYVINVPPGGGWNVKVDRKASAIRLQRRNPVTIIDVSPRPAEERQWQFTEQQIAKEYSNQEVAMMMVQGALQSLYVPENATQDTVTIDGRRLYTLSYRTVGEHFGKPNGQATLYLYFPPDFKEKHTFYRFVMHVITNNPDRTTVGFAPAHFVITSFRTR